MRYFLFTLALTALASSCVTASLGINCRGNRICGDFEGLDKTKGKTDAIKLRDMVRDIKDDSIYKNRHLSGDIKCLPGDHGSERICAFLQSLPNNEGVTGKIIKELWPTESSIINAMSAAACLCTLAMMDPQAS